VLITTHRLLVGWSGRALLAPLDLEVHCGELLAVVGRNGSGKTTLFRTLLGLLAPVGGRVTRHVERVAYVPQRLAFDDLFPVTVADVVAMGTLGPGARGALGGRRSRAAVEAALSEMAVADLATRTFRSLSEGQKQRVLLARVLATGASPAFLD
jgi:zinc transport system ATP-binding protein